jgi:hypothetical protein
MSAARHALVGMFCISSAALAAALAVRAQSWQLVLESYALRSGESIELGDVYWVFDCRSLLKGTPEVEIMEGPPSVTATIASALVMPRLDNCAEPVPGGKLKLLAGQIADPSHTTMTIRIKLHTEDGDRDLSRSFNIKLFP